MYLPVIGGAIVSMEILSEQLIKAGHEIRILSLSQDTTSKKKGNVYEIRSLKIRLYHDSGVSFAYKDPLVQELIAWKPEVVHSQNEFFSFSFAKYIATEAKAPLIHTYHCNLESFNTLYHVPSHALWKLIISQFSRSRMKNVHLIITPSQKTKNGLLAYRLQNPIKVIPTGIRLERYGTLLGESEKNAMKEQLSIDPLNAQIILCVSRLGKEKNVTELVRILKEVLKERPDTYLVIIGDGPEKKKIEKLSQELGIASRVRFGGAVPHSTIARYYKIGDVLLNASRGETQGLTYAETWASGVPLVCRRDDCLNGILEEGKNGFAFSSVSEAVSKVLRLLESPELCKQFVQEGKKTATYFSAERFGENVLKSYREIRNEFDSL
jgi:1,2-diacylglycerol 3-alpha-glucosyltransferase